MSERNWTIVEGKGPLIAIAQHAGHKVREEVKPYFEVEEADRLREEDPFTDEWTSFADTRVVVHTSRFEVDMNRPRKEAIYFGPEDAWGIDVWNKLLPKDIQERSLSSYDAFYADLKNLFDRKVEQWGHFIVYDLHSYNHRRGGPHATPANPDENPDVDVGTSTMDRDFWTPVVNQFIRTLRQFNFMNRKLDVRENVKFKGGHLVWWIHEYYPQTGCALAIEFKKFFMDEWTGKPNREIIDGIRKALSATVSPVLKSLENI